MYICNWCTHSNRSTVFVCDTKGEMANHTWKVHNKIAKFLDDKLYSLEECF